MSEAAEAFVGQRYEDTDPRSGDRVVRVVDTAETRRGCDRVVIEVVTSQFNPQTVGRRTTIRLTTLTRNYRKVSR